MVEIGREELETIFEEVLQRKIKKVDNNIVIDMLIDSINYYAFCVKLGEEFTVQFPVLKDFLNEMKKISIENGYEYGNNYYIP